MCTRCMATSVQVEVLRPLERPLCWTSEMFCGWKSWEPRILDGNALANNTFFRTFKGRSGAVWGTQFHLVVYWGRPLCLSFHRVTLSLRSGSEVDLRWRLVVMFLNCKSGGIFETSIFWRLFCSFFKLFLSWWGLSSFNDRHWTWYWLTGTLVCFGWLFCLLVSDIFSSCVWNHRKWDQTLKILDKAWGALKGFIPLGWHHWIWPWPPDQCITRWLAWSPSSLSSLLPPTCSSLGIYRQTDSYNRIYRGHQFIIQPRPTKWQEPTLVCGPHLCQTCTISLLWDW